MSKTYLVTGGTSGIGGAIASSLVRKTAACDKVLVSYGHDDIAARKFLLALDEEDRAKVGLIKSDLSDRGNLDSFVRAIASFSSHIDAAVLNVGVGTYKRFLDYEFEDWDRVLETNLTIPVFLIQKLIGDGYLEGSSVLLMGSLAGVLPYSSSVAYGVSKAGLIFAAKTLVKELEAYGSRINVVAPGFVDTKWQDGRSEESYARINSKIALHRFGLPSEVADIALSVLGNDYMNGSVVNVDGGYAYF